MRIVPVLLLGFFVCNSIKTWNMNMYFGPRNGFKNFMKLHLDLCITVQIGYKGSFLPESSM